MNRDIHNSNSGMKPFIASRNANQNFNKYISPKQRRKFLKKIFNNDASDFNKFADLITNIKSRKNAKILIDFYFYKNGIDPDAKDALEFVDIVYDMLDNLTN